MTFARYTAALACIEALARLEIDVDVELALRAWLGLARGRYVRGGR